MGQDHQQAHQLSPRHWPKEDLQKYNRLNLSDNIEQPLVESNTAIIGGTSWPLAIHAGSEVLKQGGTAADAVIATSLAQITLTAGAWNSFAGIYNMVYYDAETGKFYALNAPYNTVLHENDPLNIPEAPKPSGRTALVPGFMAGVEAVHKRFGKLPFKTLFEPAIYFAEEGFFLNGAVAGGIWYRKDVLSRLPETRKIFTKADGTFYQRGHLFKQPQLAETLRAVASQGADYMYTGAWAKKFVAAVRQVGGKMTLEDLKRYKPIWSDGLRTTYHGFEICTLGLPEFGGVELLEALNLAEVADLKQMGHWTESSEALYWFTQISRLGSIITYSSAYRPGLGAKSARSNKSGLTPLDRIKKETARRNWEHLQKKGWQESLEKKLGGHSDGVVVVDAKGNVAALLHTINTTMWGTTGLFVDGVSIPDSASFQQEMIAKVGRGVPLPNCTNPVIVLKDGKPVLASSAINKGQHEVMIQNLVNILDFGMDPKTAAAAPKFWFPVYDGPGDATSWKKQWIDKTGLPEEILIGAEKLGQPFRKMNLSEERDIVGYWLGIQIDAKSRKLRGAMSPKINGFIEGY